jgi:hypothetical protein
MFVVREGTKEPGADLLSDGLARRSVALAANPTRLVSYSSRGDDIASWRQE